MGSSGEAKTLPPALSDRGSEKPGAAAICAQGDARKVRTQRVR